MTEPLDTRALMAEIEAEARARRVSGAVPRDFEAELDAKFDALTPKSSETSFATALQHAEADALLNYQPPVASAKPGGAAAKKGLAKLSSWYIRHIGQQVTAFALSITNAVRLLGDRVELLESQVGTAGSDGVARVAAELRPEAEDLRWTNEIIASLKGTAGRVLVAYAGEGVLVRTLVDAGYEAYGVEPVDPADVTLIDPVLELRNDTLVGHLRTVGESALAGVVLTGISDRMTVGGTFDVLSRLASTMTSGATIVVVATDPEQWRRLADGAVADLASGAPLAPATWEALLTAAGFDEVTIASAEPEPILHDLSPSDGATAAVYEQLRALEAALLVPPSHLICARKAE